MAGNCSTIHYSRHQPQWPVTKSQEINVLGPRLNILHTFSRDAAATIANFDIIVSQNHGNTKQGILLDWFLAG